MEERSFKIGVIASSPSGCLVVGYLRGRKERATSGNHESLLLCMKALLALPPERAIDVSFRTPGGVAPGPLSCRYNIIARNVRKTPLGLFEVWLLVLCCAATIVRNVSIIVEFLRLFPRVTLCSRFRTQYNDG